MLQNLFKPCVYLRSCVYLRTFSKNGILCSVRINSSKSMIGHLLGGASGVEGVATVLSVYHQRMHPNINLDSPEADVDTNIVVGSEAQDREIEVALSNSFGFGGHNSVVAFRRWHA